MPGSIELALTGAAQNFSLNVINAGEERILNVTRLEFGGTDAEKFSFTTAAPFTVPPGEQAEVEFAFDPMGATGAVSASLVIESDDPQRDEVTVQLSGLIQDPKLETVAALDFGEVPSGTPSRSIDVKNAGATKDLVISGATFSGPEASAFSAVNPGTVAPGATGQISITFNPAGATGSFDAVLEIASNDPASAVTSVPVSAIVPIGDASFAAYDAAIDADHGNGNGSHPYQAVLREPATFDGAEAIEFDFGEITDDATFEFIVEGDPVEGGRDGFLAVGEDPVDNLRYEQWDDTGQLGFTRLGVRDNLFDPEDDPDLLLSPEVATHVTYRWEAEELNMELYINGLLAGTSVGNEFAMASGVGWLGAKNDTGAEGMLGTIHRVVTYDDILPPEVILRHATAFTEPGSVSAFAIVDVAVDLPGKSVTIKWPSTDGSTYIVESSEDLQKWLELADGLPADGEETSFTDDTLTGGETQLYYRVTRD